MLQLGGGLSGALGSAGDQAWLSFVLQPLLVSGLEFALMSNLWSVVSLCKMVYNMHLCCHDSSVEYFFI